MDVALLVLRVAVGLYVAAHGAQKLFGWFGGGGVNGTAGFFGGLAETGGGLAMAVGFLNPLGPIGVGASMVTATLIVHWPKGPLAQNGGYELTLTNLAVAVAVALAGAGHYSLDALFRISLPNWFSIAVAVVTVAVVAVSIATRRVPAQQEKPAA